MSTSTKLTKNEWGAIKNMINAKGFQLQTIAKMNHRSPTVVTQIKHTKSYPEYKVKYYKGYKPSFSERVQMWLR